MKRVNRKTIRNKKINEYTTKLKELQPEILNETGFKNEAALHGYLGGKNKNILNLETGVYFSEELFISEWLKGLDECSKTSCLTGDFVGLKRKIKNNVNFRNYTFLFLRRMFLKNYESYTRNKPSFDKSYYWIGLNNCDYGLFVSPRFKQNKWENDKSEIRKTKFEYWTIGHILQTGLTLPNINEKMNFHNLEDLLSFYTKVLVRSTGSKYQKEIGEYYCDYVRTTENYKEVLFLFPELRFLGKAIKHKYRLDFSIINEAEQKRIGFEISPWSSHGQLSGIKNKTQKEVNEEAAFNNYKDNHKSIEYFSEYNITCLTFSGNDLNNIKALFDDYIKPYLKIESDNFNAIDYRILQEYKFN